MAKHAFLVFLVCIALCFPQIVFAVSLEIKEYPKEITSNEFVVSFMVTGAKPATNYFRVLLYKENEHSYLAQTWNGSGWYAGSDGKSYFQLPIDGKTTDGQVKAKIESLVGTGDYLLSLKRYTASGNPANDSITPVSVHVVNSTPDPTPTLTPTFTPSISEPEDTKALEIVPEVLSSETTEPVETLAPIIEEIPTPVPSESPAVKKKEEETPPLGAYFIAIAGAILVLTGALLFVVRLKDWYTE